MHFALAISLCENKLGIFENLNLNQRPGELSNETFYKIAKKYEELNN